MTVKVLDQASGEDWVSFHGDCVEVIKGMPDASIDVSVYSPPFGNLYTYSDSDRDMGNSADDAEFLEHYGFLVSEIYRATRPGRESWVHCKNLVDYSSSSGRAGLRDFPGELIRLHEARGWKFHSRVTIWKDPVQEMQKTKAHGLLYKQLRTDSTFSRMGLAEYVLCFRKWATEADAHLVVPVTHDRDAFSLEQWQRWASPVWMDIDHTDVLNVTVAREDADEKHLCPLALPVIERCIVMGSNPGELVFSPFGGIGSEGVMANRLGRKAALVELKETYWRRGLRYLREGNRQLGLLGVG